MRRDAGLGEEGSAALGGDSGADVSQESGGRFTTKPVAGSVEMRVVGPRLLLSAAPSALAEQIGERVDDCRPFVAGAAPGLLDPPAQ